MNRILAVGALTIVLAQLGGCLALLLNSMACPEWLSHSTVASVGIVVGVLSALKVAKPKV